MLTLINKLINDLIYYRFSNESNESTGSHKHKCFDLCWTKKNHWLN